jgi:hypothetical protein
MSFCYRCGSPNHGTAEHDEPRPNLFDPEPRKLARSSDPDTSHAAARMLSGKAGTMRFRLLWVFKFNEYTAEEAAFHTDFTAADGAWKRVSDLLNDGLIEPTGETRPGTSGRQQRVLRITEKGRAVVEWGLSA